MHLKKFLLFGLIAAILPAVAEEAADRKTATSLKYVEHELDTRQNKFTAESNKAMEYTDSDGTVQKRAVTSDLDNGGTDSLPMVGGVNTKLATKQDDIAPINDHTAVTYTGQSGSIGTKGIYQDTGTYIEQSNNLIDAKTFNAALKKGLDSEFLCSEYKPGTDLCWVWSIHNTEPVSINLFDMSLIPTNNQIVRNADGSITITTIATNSAVNTGKTLAQLAPGLQVGKSYKFSINTTGTSKYIYLNSISMSWSNGESRTITQDMLNSSVLLYASGVNTTATIYDIQITEVNPEMPFTTLVPAGYTPVEYLQSDGTQYINTGHTHAQNETYEIDVMVDSVDSMYRSIIGAGSSGSVGYFYLSRTSTGMWLCNVSKQPLVPLQTKLNLKFVENNNMVQLFVNGAQGPNAAVSHYGTPLMLLARNETDAKTIGKLYGARIYDSTNSLVQNWVPARRNSDNVLGMYDSVNNVFKTNAATTGDDFTAGPDISNIVYIPQNQ